MHRNTEESLTRYEFMELLVRCAIEISSKVRSFVRPLALLLALVPVLLATVLMSVLGVLTPQQHSVCLLGVPLD